MRARTLIAFTLAAIIVVSLGALSGWYVFLRGETRATTDRDSARGFGTDAPTFAGALGSAYQNAISSVFGGGAQPAEEERRKTQELWRVTETPVAGFGFMQTENSERLYFAERSTGYIFSADLPTQSVVRLSNTLMPKTYGALFGTSGTILVRGLDESGNTTTFSGSLSTTTASDALRSLSGISLSKNIRDIALSPSGDEIFYLVQDAGKFAGVRANTRGGGQQRIFLSNVGSWHAEWLSDGRIVVVEKPADRVVGHAYEVKSGALSRIAPALPGLMVLPRASSTALVYSTSGEDGVRLFAQAGNTSTVQLPVRTVAEKCVWAPTQSNILYCAVPQTLPQGNYLDAWYRGELHTADAWWEIDVSANTARILYAPGSNLSLDVLNPIVDQKGSIAFVNAHDLSLWVLHTHE